MERGVNLQASMIAPRSLLAVCSVVIAGCAPALRAPRAPAHEIRERWLSSFVFGVFGEPALDVRDVCSSGKASAVSVGSNVGTVSVSIVTLGIYTPRKVWVACAPRSK